MLQYNLFMKWLLSSLLVLTASVALGQAPADIASEPHHHLVLENDQVRVFALTLPSNEPAYVRHEHNFLLISLEESELVLWPEGSAPVQHFPFPEGYVRFWLGGRAIGMRNDRTRDFHGVIVEFLDPKVTTYGYHADTGTWNYEGGAMRLPVDPHAKFVNGMLLGTASVSDVQLLAGDSLPPPESRTAELLIPVTAIDLKQGDRHMRKAPGEAVFMGKDRKADLLNASGGAIRFVVLELRAEPGK
jgi:hypothetical protein